MYINQTKIYVVIGPYDLAKKLANREKNGTEMEKTGFIFSLFYAAPETDICYPDKIQMFISWGQQKIDLFDKIDRHKTRRFRELLTFKTQEGNWDFYLVISHFTQSHFDFFVEMG